MGGDINKSMHPLSRKAKSKIASGRRDRLETPGHCPSANGFDYRAIVDDLPVLVCRFLPDGTLTFVNQEYCRFFGKDERQLLGSNFMPLFTPDDRRRMLAHLASFTPEKCTAKFEHMARNCEAKLRVIRWIDRAFFDPDGRLTEFQSVGIDITGRKQAERMIQQRSERLQILQDIDRSILGLRPPEEIACIALQGLRKLIPCNRASVALFDRRSRQVNILAVDQDDDIQVDTSSPWELKKSRLSKVVLEGKIQVVKDVRDVAQNLPPNHILAAGGFRSYFSVPLKLKTGVIGSLNAASRQADNFHEEQIRIAREVANSLAVAIQNARLFAAATEHQKQLSELASRLSETEESERRQLVRVLHDRVGQNLTALSLNLNLVHRLVPPGASPRISDRLEDSLHLVEETTKTIRELMVDLRPPVLDDYGLEDALEWYAEQFFQRTGVAVRVSVEGYYHRLDSVQETVLFRVFQEALTNVAKYAGAERVVVTLRKTARRFWLSISDNGAGFNTKILRQPYPRSGWGILMMRERVSALGGTLRVKSQPGKGTTVEVQLPRQSS